MADLELRIHDTLISLGLNESEIKLYSSLAINGPQTILQLSRSTKIERTKIYRLTENLEKLKLLEYQIDDHRKVLHAAPITNLETLINQKLTKLSSISQNIEKLSVEITQNHVPQFANVRFFHGIEGVKQLLWNQTHSKSEIVSILSDNIKTHTGKKFFEKWTEKCNQKGLKFRSVVDQNFIKDQLKWYNGHYGQTLKYWSSRKLPLKPNQNISSITIYDDITTFFSWNEQDIFGIEIHNLAIANTQKHFFEMLWQSSSPLSSQKY